MAHVLPVKSRKSLVEAAINEFSEPADAFLAPRTDYLGSGTMQS
jgi:hypothetical protein